MEIQNFELEHNWFCIRLTNMWNQVFGPLSSVVSYKKQLYEVLKYLYLLFIVDPVEFSESLAHLLSVHKRQLDAELSTAHEKPDYQFFSEVYV